MSAAYDEFAGAVVLVSGGGAGIGRAVVRAFLAQGARVAALDIDEAGLSATFGDSESSRSYGLRCDVTSEADMHAAFAAVEARFGPPVILVNNAGVGGTRRFEDISNAEWHRALALNLDHHFILAQLVAPAMREAGRGAIVNISSHAWMKMAANLSAYHAAKAGVVGLTRGLARELGNDRIRVNAVAPGRVFTETLRREVLTPDYEDETRRIQCLPDLIGPEDIADTVLWLASDSARMITGHTVIVDGGWV